MRLFAPDNRDRSPRHQRLYAVYELAFTVVDFMAAFLFVIGSVMFFRSSLENLGVWMFLVGSLCFALKPTIRLTRELHYLAIGDVDDVASRYGSQK